MAGSAAGSARQAHRPARLVRRRYASFLASAVAIRTGSAEKIPGAQALELASTQVVSSLALWMRDAHAGGKPALSTRRQLSPFL